ncbi:MAG: alpha/beta hydrolase [Cytophagales bacterium]|nr:alpha/beta hydrolase [Cytophagales bacterium]
MNQKKQEDDDDENTKKDNISERMKLNNQLLNHKWVIMVHGYRGDAGSIFAEGIKFYELGYNLLFIDMRGHGNSEGDCFSMGWYERIDLKGWINKIIDLDPDAQIVLYGISMGAATVMMTLGEKLPSNVKVAIEDCGYSSVYSIFLCCLKSMFNINIIPARLLLSVFTIYVKIKDGYLLTDASAVKQLKKNKRPVLFIHGDSDTFVPTIMVDKVFAASNTTILKKEKIIIKGSPHAMNAYADSKLYWNSIQRFLQKHIK